MTRWENDGLDMLGWIAILVIAFCLLCLGAIAALAFWVAS